MWLTFSGILVCFTITGATPTNPQVSKVLANGNPRVSDKLPTRGYSLTKVTMYKSSYAANLEWALNGIKLQFSPDSGVGDPINSLYGTDILNSDWLAYDTLITKRVTSVELHVDGGDVSGLRFGHPDGTKTATPKVRGGTPNPDASNFYTIKGNFIGLDVIFDIFVRSSVPQSNIAYWDDIGGNPCVVPTTVSFLQTDDVVYFLRQSQITRTYGVDASTTLCFAVQYTIKYQKGEETAVSTAFSFMTVDTSAKSIKISTSVANDVGLYKVLLTAAVSDSTFSLNGASQFQIQIKHDCENTIINGANIADITADIKALSSDPTTSTRTLSFTNTVDSTSSGYCGAYTHTLSSVLSFVQIVNGNSLEVTLTDLASIGTHDLTLSVALASYSMVTPVEKAFKVILECKVKSIVFTTQPSANSNFVLGQDVSPLVLQFSVQILPNCPTSANSSLSFSLVTATQITTQITQTQNGASLNIVPNKNNVGPFQLKLRAARDSSQADVDFQITIINPCAQASILPRPDSVVSDFSVVLPLGSRTFSQVFQIKIGMPQIYQSAQCSFTTELDSGASNISIDSVSSQITFTYAVNADLGTLVSDQQRNVIVKMDDDPSITATFAFRVQISICQITEFQTSTTSTTISYNLDSMNPMNLPFTTLFTPADCVVSTIGYTVLDKTANTAIANINADNVGVSINTSDYQLIGNRQFVYTATMAATSFMTQKQSAVTFSVEFYPGACAQATVLVPQISFEKIKYTIRDQPKLETFPPFSDSVQQAKGIIGVCGQIAYSIAEGYTFVKILAPPEGKKLTDNWSLEVLSNSQKQAGVYETKLTATLVDYPNSTPAGYSFKIELIDPCLSTKIELQEIKNMRFKVGNSAETQNFSQFSDSVSRALIDAKICGDREYSLIGAPGFVQLTVPINQWDSNSYIQVQTFEGSKAGTYSVTLSATLINYKSVAPALATFIIQIIAPEQNKKPYFASKLEGPLTVQMTSKPESWSYTFPDLKDDDNSGELTMNVDFGNASSFVVRKEKVIEVADISDASKVRPGSYFIKVTVSDSIDEVAFQVMLLVFEPIVEKTKSASCSVKLVAPENKQVTYESASTPLTVSWPRFQVETDCEKSEVSLSVKSDWSDDRFTQDSDWFSFSKASLDNTKETSFFIIASNEISGDPFQATVYVKATLGEVTAQMTVEVTILARTVQKKAIANSATQRLFVPPQMKLDTFDVTSQLTLSFDQKVIPYNQQSDEFIIHPQKFLRVSVIKNPLNRFADNPKYIQSGSVLTMRVLSFKEREIKLQIELSNPLYVSFDPLYRDILALEVIDPTYFVSALDFKTTVLKGTRLQLTIDQPLAPADAVETLKSVNSGAEKANVLATSSLPVNIVLGASLKYLWGMVNSLQFVVYMKEWKVNWPPNAKLIVETLETIALGKFIDQEKIKRKVADFYGLQIQFKSSKQPRELQASKVNLRKGRIALTAVGVAMTITSVVVAFCYALRSKYRQKIIEMAQNYKKKIFWNFFIRSYLQSFLTQSIWIVRFLVVERTAKVSANRKVFMYTVTFIFLVLIPALLTFLIHRNFKRLNEADSNQQFGSLYVGVRTTSRWSAFQVLMFLITRLGFAVISFKLRQWPGVLVLTYMILNLTNIMYVGWVFPYESFSQQSTEIFNACMLQLIAYIMLFLTNLMSGPESEFTLGWALIGVIGFMFAGNLLVMLGLNISILCRRAYLYYLRLKRRKEKKADCQQVEAVFQQRSLQADGLQIISECDEEASAREQANGVLIRIEENNDQNIVRDGDFHNIAQLLTPLDSDSKQNMLAREIIKRYAQQTASQILENKKCVEVDIDIFDDYEHPNDRTGNETPSPLLLRDIKRRNSVNSPLSGLYRDTRLFSNDSLEIKPFSPPIHHEEQKISEESIRDLQEEGIQEELTPAKMNDEQKFLHDFPILRQMMKNYQQQ